MLHNVRWYADLLQNSLIASDMFTLNCVSIAGHYKERKALETNIQRAITIVFMHAHNLFHYFQIYIQK